MLHLAHPAHIDVLLTAAMPSDEDVLSFVWPEYLPSDSLDDQARKLHTVSLEWTQLERFGRMLVEANRLAVAYAQDPSGRRPVRAEDLPAYRFTELDGVVRPVLVLEAIDWFTAQCDLHPGWMQSGARAFCEALYRRMVQWLPGYGEGRGEDIVHRTVFL